MTFELKDRLSSYLRVKRALARIEHSIRRGECSLAFGPSSLNLIMADTCNARCIMCGRDYSGCGSAERLTLENVKAVFDHLDVRQIIEIIYGGGGEPFLNPELGAIAEYARKLDPTIQHTVITNGIASAPGLVESLVRNRVNILVSINAATGKTYNEISGTAFFSRVLDNVRGMVRARDSLRRHTGISLSMVLMKRNIAELVEFVELAHELGVDGIKTLYARIYPDKYRKKSDGIARIGPEESLFFSQADSDRAVRDAAAAARKLGIHFEHEPLFACAKAAGRKCREPWKSLFINHNGDAYPCPASEVLFRRSIDAGRYRSGNVIEQDWREFWNNEFWQTLRRTSLGGSRHGVVPECLCCGNAINWLGAGERLSHVLDWTVAEESNLEL